ncbi:MAG: STAS domain-containing protein [Sulfurimicrobium sp.]
MFSFLRKSKQAEPAPAPKKPQPATAPIAPPPPPQPAATPAAASRPGEEVIVFENISAEAGSAVEEAAVYYANNMADQAQATLSQYLHDHPEKKEMQPWLMLFDLYQVQNNKPAFDELSMQFVVRFERSAPIWKMSAAPAVARKTDPAQKDLLTLDSNLAIGPQLERLRQLAQGTSNARVNLRAIASLEPSDCKSMQEGLSGCRKKGKLLQLEGVEHLVEVVKKQIAAGGHGDEDRLAWLLLFELYQWLGKEAEYEDLAIEYAVNFEISPPAWEAVKLAQVAAQSVSQTPVAAGGETGECFAMRGVISEASLPQLQELSSYAADKQEIRISMAEVPRVDFVAVGNFMSAVINLTQAGKKVLILDANEMVQALFHMMGMSEFATLIRKKSR